MRRSLVALVVVPVALLVSPAPAQAAAPANPDCWGVVTAQQASTLHDLGEHASAQTEPRLGLGNVARALLGDDAHVSDLGTLLASIDGTAVTSCP
jgi:hypothetical protein